MSLKPSQNSSSNSTTPAPAVVEKPKPVVVSFAMYKRDGMYCALAIKTQGRVVIDEKVLEMDDYRPVAQDTVDKVSHEYWLHGVDPFAEGDEA